MYEEVHYGDSGYGFVDPDAHHPTVVVFVHGWSGDARSTWTWKPAWWRFPKKASHVNLLELLSKESGLACDFLALGHAAGAVGDTVIESVADSLRTFLELRCKGRNVVLVAHSLGGLACRHAVIDLLERVGADDCPVIGILMFGTPNSGTQIARYPNRFLLSVSAGQMEPLTLFLERLNRAWLTHVVNNGDPDGSLGTRLNLPCQTVIGETDRIVPRSSASSLSLLGQWKSVRKNHRGLPKAESANDPTFAFVTEFVRECSKWAETKALRRMVDKLSNAVRRTALGGSARPVETWTLEETDTIVLTERSGPATGDILNCGIVSVRRGGKAKEIVRICVRLEDRDPERDDLDYTHLIGQGLLSEDRYLRLADLLRDAKVDIDSVAALLSVKGVTLTHSAGTQEYEYSSEDSSFGLGYAILAFRLPGAGSVPRKNELTLRLETLADVRQGWYSYFAARTVVEKITVEVQAPFPVIALQRCWWSEAPISHGRAGTGAYFSKVSVPGPVIAGVCLDWFFNKGG
jgi:pimeloyl-ACP methyl ester carboxylesterase